jgi:alpha-L-rhamnosidase
MKVFSLKRILLMILMGILPSLNEQVNASSLNPSSLMPANLRCEYLIDPLGIGEVNPRLSWEMECGKGKASLRGQKQTAFQVQVFSTQKLLSKGIADLWDSGQITSDQSTQLEYQGKPLTSRMQCFWRVRVWDKDGKVTGWSKPAIWSMGLLDSMDWKAQWIGVNEPSPSEYAKPRYLRKSFTLDRTVRRATVYATALGLYELRLNGQRVGDHLLAPEWTNYNKRVQYQTYDVTSLLHDESNTLAAMLGNGWYCGGWQFWEKKLRAIYGTEPFLLMQLEIEFSDGSRQTIRSDDSWRGITDGPLQFAGIYEGVTYDARKEMPGWDGSKFDDSKWSAVSIHQAGGDLKIGPLVWQRNEPIRTTQELPTISVSEPKPGVYVFDLGQNIAGWGRLRLQETAGTEITLFHNEVLNPDGTVYMDNLHAGHLSTGDRQIDRYICKGGGPEIFEPNFTYHGFRYVEVHGLKSKPALSAWTGIVFHSEIVPKGEFTCSNPLVNRLVQNIQWSQRANIMGVPTDCPQRDERCGYPGDMNFFMPTAIYNYDMAAFFNKWLVDLCEDSQMPDGHFADHAPYYGPGGGVANTGWSDAGIICPYHLWRSYGDTRVIREHYAAMKRNMDFLIKNSSDFRYTGYVQNGDHLNIGGGGSMQIIRGAYLAYEFRLMSEMAGAIGKNADADQYGKLAESARDSFIKTFIDQEGMIREGSQSSYALAYSMGLVPDDLKEKISGHFAAELKRFDGHIATGIIGTSRLLPALNLARHDDLAYQLLLQEDYPSWLFQVKNGATTIWERWDGWRPDKGFQDSGMNSFNHYAFGSVGEYLFGYVGGISEDAPGYKQIRIAPVIQEGLDWVNSSYISIYGRIVSNWKKEGDKIAMDIAIPANTTATVYIPANRFEDVSESGRPARQAEGVEFLRMEGAAAVFKIQSGQFHFQSTKKPSQL